MSRFPGNIIKLPNVTPTQSSASGVWSLKDQMVYQRNNLWPFQPDPYFNYTTLLLQGNVPNTTGPQAMTLPLAYNADASTNNFLVTPNGDVGPRPFSPYFGGNYSVYFDGTSGQYLNTPSNAAFAVGTGNFTLEAWVYLTGTGFCEVFTTAFGSAPTTAYRLLITTTQKLFYSDGTNSATSTASIPLNTWAHVCVVREGTGTNQTKLYINGLQDGATTSSNNLTNSTGYIGRTWDGFIFTGYISNLRLVKGTAVYTSNFTPPTQPLQNITNTSLLTCQSNRFIDNSTANSGSGFTITVNGTPRITDNSPFVSYDTTNGSGYFKGGGSQYLSTTGGSGLAVATGAFSLEGWIYFESVGTDGAGFGTCATSLDGASDRGVSLLINSGTTWRFRVGRSVAGQFEDFIGVTPLTTGQWYHFKIVRTSTAANDTKTYLNGSLQATGQSTISINMQKFSVGTYAPSETTLGVLVGYASDVRFTNTATSATVPTSPLTAVTGTQLLTLQTRAPSQNINFIDSSPNEFIVTKNGNTTQGTFSPFSPTGWGNYFNGSNTYLQITTTSATLNLGTGNYTLEGYFFFTSTPQTASNPSLLSSQNGGFIGWRPTTTGIEVYIPGVGSAVASDAFTIPVNQWVHLAAVRTSNSLAFFMNGQQQGTAKTDNNNYAAPSSEIIIARTGTGGPVVSGYISNLRIVKGVAVYTGNFTIPASPLTATQSAGTNISAITGTQTSLLTCQSNRFIDNSTNNFTITPSGSPSVQAFSPFAPANAVSPLVTGGSGYFDGSGDWLSVPNNSALNLSTGDFTIEVWVYRLNTVSIGILDCRGGAAAIPFIWYIKTSSNYLEFYTGTAYTGNVAVPTNQWVHLAVTRQSGTLRQFINGVAASAEYTVTTNLDTSAAYRLFNAYDAGADLYLGYVSGYRFLKGTALYTANFPVPTSPPTAIPNTSLLLNFTNGAAVDATGKNNLESVGNAQNSGVQAKWDPLRGGSSMYFDGTGDYLRWTTSNFFNVYQGNNTVEMWVYPTSISSGGSNSSRYGTLFVQQALGSSIQFGLGFNSSGQLVYTYWNGSATVQITSTETISVNTWSHVGFTYTSSGIALLVNGVFKTATALTGSPSASTTEPMFIGIEGRTTGSELYYQGYISNFRVTKGIARYTNNYNLPTGPFPIG